MENVVEKAMTFERFPERRKLAAFMFDKET